MISVLGDELGKVPEAVLGGARRDRLLHGGGDDVACLVTDYVLVVETNILASDAVSSHEISTFGVVDQTASTCYFGLEEHVVGRRYT